MYTTQLAAQDVAATTRYLLVDASDATYPHGEALTHLALSRIHVDLDKEGTGDWLVKIGIVETISATVGTVRFLPYIPMRGKTNHLHTYDYTDHRGRGVSGHPTAGEGWITNQGQAGSTNWQTDVTLADAKGGNTAPGQGDVVMELEEVDGAATLSFSVQVQYDKPNRAK